MPIVQAFYCIYLVHHPLMNTRIWPVKVKQLLTYIRGKQCEEKQILVREETHLFRECHYNVNICDKQKCNYTKQRSVPAEKKEQKENSFAKAG